MSHYENEILDNLKKDGLHGSYFGYEEYLGLELCVTSDDFRALILKTEFADLEVTDDIGETYKSFKSLAKKLQREQAAMAFGQIGIGQIFGLIDGIPMFGNALMLIQRTIEERKKRTGSG